MKFDPEHVAHSTAVPGKHGLYMPPQISPAGSRPLSRYVQALSRAAGTGLGMHQECSGNGPEAFGLSLMTIAAAVSRDVCEWSPLWYECLSVVTSCPRPVA